VCVCVCVCVLCGMMKKADSEKASLEPFTLVCVCVCVLYAA
jgi:hypothetical protein